MSDLIAVVGWMLVDGNGRAVLATNFLFTLNNLTIFLRCDIFTNVATFTLLVKE